MRRSAESTSGLSGHLFSQPAATFALHCAGRTQVMMKRAASTPQKGAMMMALDRDEDTLEGKLGKARHSSGGVRASFPSVSAAGSSKRARAAWFNRTRGAGKVKLAVERPAGSQRVIVKIKPVVHARVGGGGAGSVMRHALYVEREGADRDGDKVRVFDRDLERADGAAFVERCQDDRHHFRVILSPEHGDQLRDLKGYTRDLMGRVERDLGTRIDWIAAEHHDTGRPHVHVLMRGRREDGRDLVIPRQYISHTFRERAEELATRELGPRLERGLGHELERTGDRLAKLERFTGLDETLLQRSRDHEVRIADLPDEQRSRAALVRRLNRLEEMRLAEWMAGDRWRLDRELEDKLTRLADTRDRERSLARLLAREDRGLEPERTRALEQAMTTHRVTGRLVGFEQMGSDTRGPYLIGVEATDGRFWTARIARVEELRLLNGVERGAVISLERATPDLKPADRTVLDIAGESREYSAERHREVIPSDRDKYIEMHVRRLEALRMEGIVERDRNGVFHLPGDYEERVLRREGSRGRESARVTVHDPKPMEKQIDYRGPSWVDRAGERQMEWSQVAREGFGKEVREAWERRVSALKNLGLTREVGGEIEPVPTWRKQLRDMERDDLRQRIERETGRVSRFARDGERVQGIFVGRFHTQDRAYALIADDRTAALAPWRPEMDRALNQFVSGEVNGHQFDFKYGRGVEKTRGIDLRR
jgi:type IV secretory pathway VirD2 relaxase